VGADENVEDMGNVGGWLAREWGPRGAELYKVISIEEGRDESD